jgi:nucleoside 2-deoxyribosyltransferase
LSIVYKLVTCKAADLVRNLDDSDLVIALLDGSQVDDWTVWELGYPHSKKSPEQKMMVHHFQTAGFNAVPYLR